MRFPGFEFQFIIFSFISILQGKHFSILIDLVLIAEIHFIIFHVQAVTLKFELNNLISHQIISFNSLNFSNFFHLYLFILIIH